MKRTVMFLGVLCLLAATFAQVAATQKVSKSATGKWSATIRMPDGNITEEWTVEQKGDMVTGTVKAASGQLPLQGTLDNVGFFRVEVKDGDKSYKVRATIDGDEMDGSITTGVGKEYLWQAKRIK
jgi:hypothetical protein